MKSFFAATSKPLQPFFHVKGFHKKMKYKPSENIFMND